MNEHGLAVALAFGGRKVVGEGFAITLVLRYVLEFCQTTAQAIEVLSRVPSHMGYNISVVDRAGAGAVVYVNPDRPAEVAKTLVATNHQRTIEWPEHADLSASLPRAEFLGGRLADPAETLETFIGRFLDEPLFARNYDRAFGTLYTAIYCPARGTVEYRWRNRSWHQTFDRFLEGASVVSYG